MSDPSPRVRRTCTVPLRAFRVLLVLALAGCRNLTGADDPEREALNDARARWRASGPASYDYRYRIMCYCGDANVDVTVSVRDGRVATADYTDPAIAAMQPTPDASRYDTIDDLLELVADAIRRDAYSLHAEYDPAFGHPTTVSVDYRRTVADDELAWTVRDLVAR